jgi:Kef-type K+ transport system membrane component KefB/nucleotide-binding universal stress UspA family protein
MLKIFPSTILLATLDNSLSPVFLVLLEILLVIGVSRLTGLGFRAIKQPLVLGEIVAGILLGPSFLGAIWPQATDWLFPASTSTILEVLAQIGLIFFMFLIGLEIDPKYLKGKVKVAFVISLVGIVLPFLLASLLALWLYPFSKGADTTSLAAFMLFLGSALSITAFPVLARIISENNLQNTPIGTLALTCAAVDDVVAWCLLAVSIAVARTNSMAEAMPTIGFAVLYIGLMLTVGRWLLKALSAHHDRSGKISQLLLAGIYMAVVASALITEMIGIHYIFGAFLLGAAMPKNPGLIREIARKTEDFVLIFLLPVFFVYSGLKTKIGLIDTPYLWLVCGVILAVAIAGKYLGVYLTARYYEMDKRESSVLGWLMNTRGLTELIVLNIGLKMGVINELLFAMLVIMALTTTFMTSPLIEWIYPKRLMRQNAATPSQPVMMPAAIYRLLVPVANPNTQKSLVQLAMEIARNPSEASIVQPLSLIELEEDYLYQSSPVEVERLISKQRQLLTELTNSIEPPTAGQQIQPIVQIGYDVAKKTATLAALNQPDLILLGWHRSAFSHNKLGGRVRQILATAPADVAVFVDVEMPTGDREYGQILVPYTSNTHDDMSLELALRMLFNDDRRQLHLLQLSSTSSPVSESSYDMNQLIANLPGDVRSRIQMDNASGNLMDAVVKASRQVDLTIAGTSRNWGIQRHSLGRYTDELAQRCHSPLLIARRFSQLTSHLGFLLDTNQELAKELLAPPLTESPRMGIANVPENG